MLQRAEQGSCGRSRPSLHRVRSTARAAVLSLRAAQNHIADGLPGYIRVCVETDENHALGSGHLGWNFRWSFRPVWNPVHLLQLRRIILWRLSPHLRYTDDAPIHIQTHARGQRRLNIAYDLLRVQAGTGEHVDFFYSPRAI